jgi:hypothetical protein
MTDKDETARYDSATYDGSKYPDETAAPTVPGEAMQRHINRTSKHSERVFHGGNRASGDR